MKHISVVFFDIEQKTFIEHECIPEGEVVLSPGSAEGLINIFLITNELALEEKIFSVVSRRFSIDKHRLIISVKQKNK